MSNEYIIVLPCHLKIVHILTQDVPDLSGKPGRVASILTSTPRHIVKVMVTNQQSNLLRIRLLELDNFFKVFNLYCRSDRPCIKVVTNKHKVVSILMLTNNRLPRVVSMDVSDKNNFIHRLCFCVSSFLYKSS